MTIKASAIIISELFSTNNVSAHERGEKECQRSELRKASPSTAHFVVSSVHAQDPVYLLRYVRESTMRSPLYAVRRSLRLLVRESTDNFTRL